jgi:hypothetical protein
LETFSLSGAGEEEKEEETGDILDADSFFNLPDNGDEDEQP